MPKGKYIRTAEIRSKISAARKGKPAWNKGIKHSEETKLKISKAKKGSIPWNKGKKGLYKATLETRKKQSIAHLGKKMPERSEEWRIKQSIAHLGKPSPNKGKKFSFESRIKMSEAHKKLIGEKNPFYGKHHSIESRRKMSEAHKKLVGEKNPFYGKHHTEYSKIKQRLAHLGKPAWNKGKKGIYSEETLKLIRLAQLKAWQNPNYKQKQSTERKARWERPDYVRKMVEKLKIRPSEPEKKLDKILQSNFPNVFKYTGDGQYSIGGKIPDWTDEKDRIVIEYNGYKLTHTPERDKAKTEHYNKNGWRVINIYPDDLKDTNKLINKIKNFLQNK